MLFIVLALALGVALSSCSGIAPAAASQTTAQAAPASPSGPPASQPAESAGTAAAQGTASDPPAPSPTPSPTPTPGIEETPPPAATQELLPDRQYVARVALNDTSTWLNIRSQPDENAVVLGCVPHGSLVTIAVAGVQWHKILFEDGFGYVLGKYVTVERALEPGETPPPLELMYASPKPTKGTLTPAPTPTGTGEAPKAKELKDNLVDVHHVDGTIICYMIFATENNFMGKPLYPKKLCLLQKETAEKLKKAEELFMKDGYRIKIYDAYRPISVQKILYSKIKNGRWIAKPGGMGSCHNRGCAVDMTLVDKDGNELEMQSKVHEFSEKAYVNSKTATKEAKKNWDYMWSVMKKCGFRSYQYEWWHFEDTNSGNYLPTDYNFMKIPMVK